MSRMRKEKKQLFSTLIEHLLLESYLKCMPQEITLCKTLKTAAIEMGLRTKKGEPLAISQINKILKKPFYCGMMDTKYGIVEHCYEPLISQALFQQVQDVINGYHKKPHKMAIKPFIFKGLITCSNCGCVVTPEIHKGRYVYYSCTNAKKICKRVYVKEEDLVKTLSEYLDQIALSEEQIDERHQIFQRNS